MKKLTVFFMLFTLIISGCGGSEKKESNRVIIYSSMEDYRNDYFNKKLKEKFPNYNVVIEYLPSGNLAAKLKAEGLKTSGDIVLDLEYGYAEQLKNNFVAMPVDKSRYVDELVEEKGLYVPICRVIAGVIVNKSVLQEKNLQVPQSYSDLLNPDYKGLISMPNPKSSGTGYILLKSLSNAWGEDKALAYFDNISNNVLQFTSSGSGPVKALVNKEAAIGLGMPAQAVLEINKGANLEILFFKEGAPYTAYAAAVIKGKETRKPVREVFEYIETKLIEDNNKLFFPDKIYKDKNFTMKNYPTNIVYADMKNSTIEEKERLLTKWKY